MKNYAEAYLEPAVSVLGEEGIRVAAWRFCCHLSYFATAHTNGYRPADTARRLRLRDSITESDRKRLAGIREPGSPFTTITTGHTGFSRGGI